MSTLAVWQAMSYGYTPIWWLTVAGVPVTWAERATGRTSPADFAAAQSGALVLDDAPIGIDQVDRDRGIATGLPLGFKLLDSATLAGYLRAPSLFASLTADLDAADSTAIVDDTAGWPASGVIYVGQEAIAYSSKTSTTFAGLSRAQYGTLRQTHKVGTTGQIVTNRARYWSGREVRLYAAFCDPSGHVCGTALADQSVEVWRGRLEGMPVRDNDGWRFSAYALDRVVDVPLPKLLAGKVTSLGGALPVDPTLLIQISIAGYGNSSALLWGYDFALKPFAALTIGDALTFSESRQLITDAWDAAVAAAYASELGTLEWVPFGAGVYRPRVALPDDNNLRRVRSVSRWPGSPNAYTSQTTWGGQEPDDATHALGINTDDSGAYDWIATNTNTAPLPPSLTIAPDSDPGQVPEPGLVRLTAGAKSGIYSYANTATVGQSIAIWPIAKVSGDDLQQTEFAGADVEILSDLSLPWPDALLTVLESSGTGYRGSADTLPAEQGYALPETAIDVDSIALLDDAPANLLACSATTAAKSVPDTFGGLLALCRFALVSQPTNATGTPVQLQLVRTVASGEALITIGDADLLAHAQEPVVSVQRATSPNQITITPSPAGEDLPAIIYHSRASQEALGVIAVDWTIPTPDRDALLEQATPLVASQFAADQTGQAVQLIVHPGCTARVGDAVWLSLTHPALWDWQAGQPGYTGVARVVGRTIEPDSCAVTLRLLLDGAVAGTALSPSAVVKAFSSSTAPAWIDVPPQYLAHFAASLQGVASIRLDAYRPGQVEAPDKYHTITAAAIVGSYCRLTVSATSGGHTLVADSTHLTLPRTANANPFQRRYAHADDGTSWV